MYLSAKNEQNCNVHVSNYFINLKTIINTFVTLTSFSNHMTKHGFVSGN